MIKEFFPFFPLLDFYGKNETFEQELPSSQKLD